MIPIRLVFQPGIPLFEQVVYAARKAVVSGQMRPGDAFPSVRVLSRELKINPNTAHKVVTHLINEGLLEVRPGIGAFVAAPRVGTREERRQLLGTELEDLTEGLAEHWRKLGL